MGSRVIKDENFGFCIRLRADIKLSKDRNKILKLTHSDISAVFELKLHNSTFISRIEGYQELLKLMIEKYDNYYSLNS